jgi:pullulanase
VHLRTSAPALSVNDTEFIHVDFNDNKRVLVWKRGGIGQDPVVVVANFSDYATPNGLTDPAAEYVVPNWPATPPGRHWREVPQQRDVRPDEVRPGTDLRVGSQGLHPRVKSAVFRA